jgi:hypothetical protein
VFATPEEAQIEAERLARLGETYTIDRFEHDCPQCEPNFQSIYEPSRKTESH